MNERERIQALEARVSMLEAKLAGLPIYERDPGQDDVTLYAKWPHKIPQGHPHWGGEITVTIADPIPPMEYQVTSQVRG